MHDIVSMHEDSKINRYSYNLYETHRDTRHYVQTKSAFPSRNFRLNCICALNSNQAKCSGVVYSSVVYNLTLIKSYCN